MTVTSEVEKGSGSPSPSTSAPEVPRREEVLDSEGYRIEKFCPKCYVFRTPKENYCIVCGTKLKEIKLKPRAKK